MATAAQGEQFTTSRTRTHAVEAKISFVFVMLYIWSIFLAGRAFSAAALPHE
jgi:hypothetical protein